MYVSADEHGVVTELELPVRYLGPEMAPLSARDTLAVAGGGKVAA